MKRNTPKLKKFYRHTAIGRHANLNLSAINAGGEIFLKAEHVVRYLEHLSVERGIKSLQWDVRNIRAITAQAMSDLKHRPVF